MFGCIYFENVAKSFFIRAVAISMACTLIVVARFCPSVADEMININAQRRILDRFFIRQIYNQFLQ
jgi:hypothetical protein